MASIIQIKGTSGSGKTTLVQKFMHSFKDYRPIYVEGRRQPLYYLMKNDNIAVLGHYECGTGGCDNIKDINTIFNLIEQLHSEGRDVIFEGLMITNDRERIYELHRRLPGLVHVIALNTSLTDCKYSIRQRKNKKALLTGKPAPLEIDFSNTEAKYRSFLITVGILQFRSMQVHVLERDEALGKLFQLTGTS
jgi:ABC-type phosphate transport system ATPase subunit